MITKIIPHPCLDGVVDYYWTENSKQINEKLLPDGAVSIVFNIGGPVGITDANDKSSIFTNNFIIGTQSKYIIFNKKADTKLVGVKFKQGGAYHFIKKPLHFFKDKITDLNSQIDDDVNQLNHVLSKAENDEDIRKILNYYFFINIDALEGASKIVDSVIQSVSAEGLPVKIQDVCEQNGISNKHLITLFNRKVGLTPKALYCINKFNKVISLISNSNDINWSQVAYECHYYDQAHMIHDFKKFSGMLPSDYATLDSTSSGRITLP